MCHLPILFSLLYKFLLNVLEITVQSEQRETTCMFTSDTSSLTVTSLDLAAEIKYLKASSNAGGGVAILSFDLNRPSSSARSGTSIQV